MFDPSSFSAAGAVPEQIDTELGNEGLIAIAVPVDGAVHRDRRHDGR